MLLLSPQSSEKEIGEIVDLLRLRCVDLGIESISLDKNEVINLDNEFYYYTVSGLQCILVKSSDNERVIDFLSPPCCTSMIQKNMLNDNDKSRIKCFTKSNLFRISKASFKKLVESNQLFERHIFKQTEQTLQEIANRYFVLNNLPIEERFECFLSNRIDLLQKVPNKYLASYLNIHHTNFSTLLGKVRLIN